MVLIFNFTFSIFHAILINDFSLEFSDFSNPFVTFLLFGFSIYLEKGTSKAQVSTVPCICKKQCQIKAYNFLQ